MQGAYYQFFSSQLLSIAVHSTITSINNVTLLKFIETLSLLRWQVSGCRLATANLNLYYNLKAYNYERAK